MWTLLLSRASEPHTTIDRRQIDGGQIKIGRSIGKCDWVIPDQEGFVSGEHCTILVGGIDLFVIDTSSNGTALNHEGAPLPPHQPVPIRVNDRLLLGSFVIEIAPEGAAAVIAPPSASFATGPSVAQTDDWFQAGSDPIWNAGRRDAEVHEFLGGAFDDFMGAPAESSRRDTGEAFGAVGLGAAFSRPIMAPMTPGMGDFGIPEDWASVGAASTPAARDPFAADPFATNPSAADPFSPDPFAAKPPTSDPFAPDPFASDPRATDSFANDPFAAPAAPGWPQPGASGDAADPFADPSSTALVPGGFDDIGRSPPGADPFADFFAAPIADPGSFPPLPASAPAPAAPPPPPAPSVQSPTADAASGEADWAAFCEGAGIDPADFRRSPDAMRQLGVLYKQVVLGLSDLIQDRAAFKSEFRLGVTTLAIGRNNPLKMLDPRDTAKLMLDRPMPGFMPADEAIRSAFADIKKHQMAMLAGVQHALTAVFQRLAPTEIERLMQKAASARRGPFRRGVDPWTVYQTVFDALRVDATSNANSVMSVAFREGYEAFLKGDPGRS